MLRVSAESGRPESPRLLRALGPVERSLLQYHDGLAGSGNTARIVALEGPLTGEVLAAALAVLQCRHPFLRAGIARTPAPVFVDRPDALVPVDRIVRTGDDDWVAVVEDTLARSFAIAEGPLLRVTWLDGAARRLPHMLVLTTCHVVTDGFTSSAMAAELLEILAALDAGATPSRSPHPLPPPMSALLPAHASGLAGTLRVGALLGRQILRSATLRPAPVPSFPAPLHERRTRVLPYALPLDTIARLGACAKREGTTLHSALLAAKLTAAATLIESRGRRRLPMRLAAVTTTNLRTRLRRLDAAPELAARVGGFRSIATVYDTHGFWPLARRLADDLRRGLARNDDMLATFLAPVFSRLQKRLPGLAAAAVQLANLGRSPVQERYGRFRVSSVHAALNVCGFGPSLMSHVTTTATGTYWNVLYCEPLVRRDDARAFATATMRLLEDMAAAP